MKRRMRVLWEIVYTYGRICVGLVPLHSASAGRVFGLRDPGAIVSRSENWQLLLSSEFDGDEAADRARYYIFYDVRR